MEPDSPSEPKFRRRAKARPGEVLDAALALFTEQGFARTSVAQIAKRADLSKGAVYLYFPSKDAILEGLVERMIAPLSDEVFERIASHQGDPRPLLAQFLRMLAAMLGDDTRRAVPMIVLREALAAPDMAKTFRKAVLDRALPAVTALLAQGMAGGFIRPLDPELTARTVVGPIMAHIILHEVFSITPRDGLAIERLVENHLAILLAGLAPEKGANT
ncbi:TetR/AcrR family transcriptional regulator [Abyssibius alkaniclasticus]|uniref:TetR/AcrR family transcriptional regulator n=1 Tax=Abyssibius alkaniclasticus TaxID=2881234 RepID=UPI0023649CD7|nr:TetR/AcrR family transcriptional regulator [Abyssibius alkaniclasticus]UPH72274.1 TetR/AcrR family transcriptional regulator [Abyssibius alkaniclasticus]